MSSTGVRQHGAGEETGRAVLPRGLGLVGGQQSGGDLSWGRVGALVNPILQVTKLRHREAESLAQSHTVGRQSWIQT